MSSSFYSPIYAIEGKTRIDKSLLLHVFAHSDYLLNLRYVLLCPIMLKADKEKSTVIDALTALFKKFNSEYKALEEGLDSDDFIFSSENSQNYFINFIKIFENYLEQAGRSLDVLQADINREIRRAAIQDGRNFIKGIKVLLNEKTEPINLRAILQMIIKLTFSDYYIQRDYHYSIDIEGFADKLPEIRAPVDDIGFLFLALLLAYREMYNVKVDVKITCQVERINHNSFTIIVKVTGNRNIYLKNVTVCDKDTSVGYRLASKIVKGLNGGINPIKSNNKVYGFEFRLPVVKRSSN